MKVYSSFTVTEAVICFFVVIVIMSGIVLLFDPSRMVSEKRNDLRTDDITNILNAVSKYIEDNNVYPKGIKITDKCELGENEICRTDAPNCSEYISLEEITTGAKYLPVIPTDPKNKSVNGTGYNIVRNESGKITVCSPKAELGVEISISK